jgi:isopenicillin-N N-acyltransferase like protein
MARRWFVGAVCLLPIFWSAATAVRADPPFRYPEGRSGTGELKYVNGLPVLTVGGTPEEIGTAIGALALSPARRMQEYPHDLARHFHAGGLWGLLVRAGQRMVERFPDDYRVELETLAKAGYAKRDNIVAGNTLFDVKKFLCCSALLVEPERSGTGGPLLGRNLDYPSLGYAHDYSLVTVYRPAGAKHAFASIGFPGLVGCLSGMNDAGLAVAVLEVFQVKAGRKRFDSAGLPYALCYRRLLEECATVAEAEALLAKMKRTTITNLVVADRERVAVFEITPRHVVVRPPEAGTCVCTNHFCSATLRPRTSVNLFATNDRYRALDTARSSRDVLGVADLQHALHAASMKSSTMQTMVFEPAELRLHLAIGTCPSSAAEMKLLNLAPLFAGPMK